MPNLQYINPQRRRPAAEPYRAVLLRRLSQESQEDLRYWLPQKVHNAVVSLETETPDLVPWCKVKSMKTARQSRILTDFPHLSCLHSLRFRSTLAFNIAENCARQGFCSFVSPPHCTNSCHRLVKLLHSTVLKADIPSCFSLTIKIEGVKTESFFDTF